MTKKNYYNNEILVQHLYDQRVELNYHDLINVVYWKSTLSSLNTSLGFLYIIIAINYWIRDVIREYIKKYEVLIIMLFIVFLTFVFSEGLLFLSFFWVSFHSSCSLNWTDGIYVPDPCELTYTNTLLLSNAALSLGCAFICEEAAVDGGNFSIISFILAWTFNHHIFSKTIIISGKIGAS